MSGSVEVREFVATCPAGTAIATPTTTSLAMPPRQVNRIRVRIPPGPNGVMGFAIGSAGEPIIPGVQGTWIVASDEVFTWDLADLINSGAWEVRQYNTGIFDHSIYITYEVQLPDIDTAGATSNLVTSSSIEAASTVTSTVTPVPAPPVLEAT